MLTENEHIQADSQGPDVSKSGLVRPAAANFWRHESGGPSRSIDQVSDARKLGATEVRDFEMSVGGQQEIVRLQVAVRNFCFAWR